MQLTYYLPLLVLIFLLLYQKKTRNLVLMNKFIKNKNTEDRLKMLELAKRFIDKDVVIYTFDSHQYLGIIREVTEGALLIENNGAVEALNLDFVLRIREYPRNKKGKKKSVVLD